MGKGLRKEDSAALKGLAVLIMVIIHGLRAEKRLDMYGIIFRGVTRQQVLDFIPYGKICVSIFAFVSGFGLMYSYIRSRQVENPQSVSKWVGSYLIKTLSGFWFIATLSYIVSAVFRGETFSRWGETFVSKAIAILTDILGFSELFNTKSLNGTWWYMSAAAVYILLIPVIAGMIEKYGGLVCAGLIIAIPRVLGIEYQGGNSVLSFLFVMALGMICCKYNVFEKFSNIQITGSRTGSQIIKFIVLALLVVFGRWSFDRVDTATFMEYKFAVIPFFVMLFCVEFLFKIKIVSRIFQFLGKHSMNIWLVHTFVRDWAPDLVYSVKEFWMIPLVMLGVSLVISYILDLLKKISGYDALTGMLLNKMK